MPGIAASLPSDPPPPPPTSSPSSPLAFHHRALLYRHSMHPFTPSITFLSISVSLGKYVPAGPAAMPMDYHGLSSRISREHSLFERTCARHTCACTCVRSVIGNPGERTYLSTGNKLTSCRKLANVPWEDTPGGGGGNGGTGGGVWETVSGGRRNKKCSFARRPEMRIRLGKTAKTFYSRFIIHGAGFCDKCAVTGKNNERQG